MRPATFAMSVTVLLVASALVALPTVLLLGNVVSAHDCRAEDPENSCGDCERKWYGGTDRHEYNNGTAYCEETVPTPRPICGGYAEGVGDFAQANALVCPP